MSARAPLGAFPWLAGIAGTLAVAAMVGGLLAVQLGDTARAQLAVRDARFEFLVQTIRSRIEANVNLGLMLSGLGATQDLLERSRVQDADILSVDVFDDQGNMLFSSDRGGLGDRVPADWLAGCTAAQPAAPALPDAGERLVCAPLLNNYDRVAGAVALRYRVESRLADAAGAQGPLARAAALTAAVAAVLVLGIVLLLLPLHRGLVRLRDAVAARDSDCAQAAGVPGLDAAVAGGMRRLDGMQAVLDDAEREAERIDDLDLVA